MTTSPDGTLITPSTGTLVDSRGHAWSFSSQPVTGGVQVCLDGGPAHNAGGDYIGAVLLTIQGGNTWYQTDAGVWWLNDDVGHYVNKGATAPTTTTGSTPNPTPNPTPTPTPVPSPTGTASVTVTNNPAGLPVDTTYACPGVEKVDACNPAMFTAANAALVALYKRLGPGVIAFAGNGTEVTSWVQNGPGGVFNLEQFTASCSPPDVDRVAGFLKATGWKALWGIAFNGTASNASPQLAAAEAAYVAQAFGDSLYGIRFGNEPDLGGAYNGNYWQKWQSFAQACRTAVPGIKISGPACAENPPYQWDIQGRVLQTGSGPWTQPFVYDAANPANYFNGKSLLDQVAKHYYKAGAGPNATMDFLLNQPDDLLVSNILDPLAALAANPGIGNAPGGTFPPLSLGARMDEAGTYFRGGQPGVSDAWGSALWTVYFSFLCAQRGLVGVNYWGGEGSAYSPIKVNDANGQIVQVAPGYYGMLAFNMVASGKLATLSVNGAIDAYAVSESNGACGVVLVNRDPVNAIAVTMNLPISPAQASATLFTAPSLGSMSGFTAGGVAFGTDGGGTPSSVTLPVSGSAVTVNVPPGSIQVVIAK